MNPVHRHRIAIAVEERLDVSSQSHTPRSTQKALVLIPAGMNYYHELHGHRLAEALRSLGLVVDVGNLGEQIDATYDLCVLTNISEMLFGSGSAAGVTSAIGHLRPYCRAVACCLHDSTDINSYEEFQRRYQATGIGTILDIGFHDRSAALPPSVRSLYHFVPNGLTSSEQEAASREKSEEERPIPWVFIGHATAPRVALVNNLITRVDPRGFVYMPNLGKDAVKEVQTLNQRQYETVLRKCCYHIWFSPYQHFCLESERFRLSLLTGCVPIKVIAEHEDGPSSVPFDYLALRESEAAGKIRQFDFHEMWRRFHADFLAFPSLAEGLAKFLISRSLLPGGQPSIVQSKAA